MGCISSKNASCLMDQDDTRVQANPKEEHANSQNRVLDYSLEASTRHSRKSSRRVLLLGGSESSLISGGLSHYNRNIEAEQAAAGWPTWLCSAASEAVRGWVPLKAEAFQKLEKIGQGTYSSVFRAREVETGKMVALKKVKFDNLQQESIRFMAREILILRRLNHPNIMKLEGIVTSRASSSIYLVFEYMEHDLAGLSSNPDINFTESQIKCYMKQLLWGLEHCHMRGVIHRDIKASNILVNNKGVLKLGDFGLANVVTPKNKNQLTSRVVTLWYRAPELLMGSTSYGVSIDLWSVGCVFAEILMGKPILKGRTEIEQLHKIYKLCGSPQDSFWKKTKLIHATTSFKPTHNYEATLRERCKDLSTTSLFLLETLLSMEPYKRGTASSALHSEYFLTRPYACDPSSLPKYPPNKEMDAKYRDDMRRKRANLKLRDSGVSRKHKRPHRTEHDSKTYAKLPIRQDTFEVKNIPNETYRETAKTHENYYKLSDIPMTTGPASGFAWAEKRRKDPDNISTLTYIQPSSRSQLSETSVAFAKNTFGLDLKSDKDSVWEIQESDYDHVLEEVPREIKLSRIGERHGSFDGCGLDFSQIEEDSPKNNLKHIQGGKQSISGPLIFKSGKIEEILKMNESNIRQAVRKSHFQREKDENKPESNNR